jgi:hypothetical protein
MVKSLINRIKRGICIAAAGLFLTGCPNPIPQGPHAPNVIVYANPNSGRAPLNTNITVDGEDADGDITEYKLEIDEGNDGTIDYTKTQSTPINIAKTFNDGTVKIYGQCTDSTGLKNGKTVYVTLSQPSPSPQPTPTPLPSHVHIRGHLQDNETDTDKAGEVRAYVNGSSTPLTDENADAEEFDFTVPYGSDVELKGKITEGNGSYVRTVHLDDVAADEDINLRAVPYPDFDGNGTSDNVDEFKAHMQEINFAGITGLKKWNLVNGLNKIKIFYHNGSQGDFADGQPEFIEEKIYNDSDIEKFVDGKQLEGYVEIVDGDAPLTDPEDGYIYIIPDNSPGGDGMAAGFTYCNVQGNMIKGAKIELDPDCVREDNPATTHEFGHAFIAPDGEASTLASEYTIMKPTGNMLLQPGVADDKAAKIIYEDTYINEKLDDVLGTSWY